MLVNLYRLVSELAYPLFQGNTVPEVLDTWQWFDYGSACEEGGIPRGLPCKEAKVTTRLPELLAEVPAPKNRVFYDYWKFTHGIFLQLEAGDNYIESRADLENLNRLFLIW